MWHKIEDILDKMLSVLMIALPVLTAVLIFFIVGQTHFTRNASSAVQDAIHHATQDVADVNENYIKDDIQNNIDGTADVYVKETENGFAVNIKVRSKNGLYHKDYQTTISKVSVWN